MTVQTETDMPAKQARVSAEEWATRVDLAAAYRLFHLLGMTDLVYTHMSARVPGEDDRFLINPYGLMFHEVTASNLVKVDADGNLAEDTEWACNPAGFTIHSAIHAARPEAGSVIHLHTTAGMAVSAQKDGLLPLTQHSLRWYNRLAYHDYEGIALDLAERERLAADLGNHHTMLLRNHGFLTVGHDVREAAILAHYFEQSCREQVAALAGGRELIFPAHEICEHTARQYEEKYPRAGTLEWEPLVRWIEREEGTGYRT